MNLKNVFLILFELSIQSRILNVLALGGEGIVGSIESPIEKYRYQVSIQENGIHFCGGGIVRPLYVVTAAHCVIDTKTGEIQSGPIQVVGGTNDLNLQSSMRKTSEVSQIHVPNEFLHSYRIDRTGDIAVLKLKRALNFIDYPYLILPLPSNKFVGRTAVVTGFGSNEIKFIRKNESNEIFEKIERDGKLRFAHVRVLKDKRCLIQHGLKHSESRFCAEIIAAYENEHRGICYGDSGGPLVIDDNILIGIVSHGTMHCNEDIKPSIYTNVTSFLPFIEAVLHGRSHTGITLVLKDDNINWNQLRAINT